MFIMIFHLLFLLLFPPFLPGVINKTKALFAGRVGVPLFQYYFDIIKLMKKGMVLSSTTTWIFRAGPVIGLVVPVMAGLLMPMGNIPAIISFPGIFSFLHIFLPFQGFLQQLPHLIQVQLSKEWAQPVKLHLQF